MRRPPPPPTRRGDISFIPAHMLEEIFLRLDAASLFRCAFVCREWNKLITSADFISRSGSDQSVDSRKQQIIAIKACRCRKSYVARLVHFSCCQVTYSLHWDNDEFEFLRTIDGPAIKGTRVIGVSNGLVCLAIGRPLRFILWNPVVRKYVWIPLAMTWDEALCDAVFGFDRTNSDFKVVNIVYRSLYCHRVDSVWVFSYIRWSWKRIEPSSSIPSSCEISLSPNACLNGVFHWIATRNITHQFIITFDLTHEVVGQMLLPTTLDPRCSLNDIVKAGEDSLAVVELKESYDDEADLLLPYVLSVWIMKQYGNHESWTKMVSITLEQNVAADILAVRKNGDLILETTNSRQIYRYNPTSSTNVVLGVLENSVFFPFTGSLYLLEKRECVSSYQ